MDLRLASALGVALAGKPFRGKLPGCGAYWLPKFVDLGNARGIFLIGAGLTA
jgi:hypothetical protein